MAFRTVMVKIPIPQSGGTGMQQVQQVQQEFVQIHEIPESELAELEGRLGDSLGEGTTEQMFQGQARALSRQSGDQGTGVDLESQSVQPQAVNDNSNPLVQNSLSRTPRIGDSSSIDSQLQDLGELGGGGGYFEDRIFAIMCKVVEDMQKKIEERLKKLQGEAEASEKAKKAGGEDSGSESRNIEFEKIKFDMQKLSQMQQALSNVLNSMDELAKSAIRQIKGG